MSFKKNQKKSEILICTLNLLKTEQNHENTYKFINKY